MKISKQDYEAFRLNWLTVNRGKTNLGEAFCNYFFVVDDVLMHEENDSCADDIIVNYYLDIL